MNKFDFIHFTFPSEYIVKPNLDILGTVTDSDLTKYVLGSRGKRRISEYDFKIAFSLTNVNANIGFSAKILGKDYPELINYTNISTCIELLSSKYKLCQAIDVDNALKWGVCNRLEVTRDINLFLSPKQYKHINNLIVQTHKWSTLNKNGNTYEGAVGAMRHSGSESIILYDKGIEMTQDKHQKFVVENELQNRFDGITRIESKLNSRKAIRRRFGAHDLLPVLQSDRNPLNDLFEEVVVGQDNEDIKAKFINSQRDRERYAYAKDFGFDFGKISEDLRSRSGKNWKRDYKAIMDVTQGENPEIKATFELAKNIKNHLIFN